MKNIISVFVGIVLCFLLIFAIEQISHLLISAPAFNLDPSNKEAIAKYVQNLPVGHFVFLLAAWYIGPFAGSFVMGKMLSPYHMGYAAIIGGLFGLGTLINLLTIAHPTWVNIAAGYGIFPCAMAFLGIYLAKPNTKSATIISKK